MWKSKATKIEPLSSAQANSLVMNRLMARSLWKPPPLKERSVWIPDGQIRSLPEVLSKGPTGGLGKSKYDVIVILTGCGGPAAATGAITVARARVAVSSNTIERARRFDV